MIQRRSTIPQELDDPEDIRVNQESFEGGEVEYDDDGGDGTSGDDGASGGGIMQRIHGLPKEARNLLAGGAAGMVAKSVVAPLDRIKIMYQVTDVPYQFRRLPQVMHRIVSTEGFDALWKGNVATMVRIFPYSGIQFMTYDRIKGYFLYRHSEYDQYLTLEDAATMTEKRRHGLTPLESLVAGMTAGTCSVVCTYPLDLTRAQLAVLRKHKRREHVTNKSFVGVLVENYTRRGLFGLFRGMTPTIIGILPYSGIAFTLNEQGKKEIMHFTGRDLTTIERMVCGAFAGLVAQTLTYPLEVTRRRMQTLGVVGDDTAFGSLRDAELRSTTATTTTTTTTATTNTTNITPLPRSPISSAKTAVNTAATKSTTVTPNITANTTRTVAMNSPPTLASTIRTLYAEQGMKGFFKGVTMNWIKGPVAFSISFTTYDTMQALFLSTEERAKRIPLHKRLTRPV